MTILNSKPSLLRVVGILGLLAGLATAANTAAPATHAGSGRIRIFTCFTCFLPKISVTNLVHATDGHVEVDPSSVSLNVSGTNFPAGDPVHVELVSQDPSSSGSVMAAGDTAASLALNLPLGDGQYARIAGGTFTIALVPDPGVAATCNWQQMTATVVATDQSTGARVSTPLLNVSGWWLHNAIVAQSCPTATPVAPTATPESGM
jgi:hypothetical protein